MKEERPSDQQGERDSQLSAMFDGELSAAECELLARRLARDEALRGQWSRYAMIGAAVRAERGVKLDDRVARRVQAQIAQEATYGESADTTGTATRPAAAAQPAGSARVNAYERWLRFARPVAGASIAAGVAAMSILWLRNQEPDPAMMAAAPAAESIVLEAEAPSPAVLTASAQPQPERPVSNGEPERYSTPAPSSQTSIAPPARFANYVVAHSEVSGPLARRMALLGIVGTEGAEAADQPEARQPETKQPEVRGTVDAP